MPNPNRPASRSPSIPIPGASGRSIEELLNLNALGSPPSPAGAGASTSARSQHRATAIARSLYSGLEASRPSVAAAAPSTSSTTYANPGRHVSASSSLGDTAPSARHPLGGGSGPPWALRSVSMSSTALAGNHAGSPRPTRIVTGFEPRVIRGSAATPTERYGPAEVGHTPSRSPTQRRDSHPHPSTSPTRAYRMSAGGRPPTSRSIPSAGVHSPSAHIHSAAPAISFGSHLPGSGAPATFKRPAYLQYCAFRGLIRTDGQAPSAPPRPASLLSHPLSSTGRAITPLTESDDDSESSIGFTTGTRAAFRRSHDHDRGLEKQRDRANAYVALLAADPVLYLPTRWNEQDRNKFLTVSDDGRNLQFHGPHNQGEKEAAAARANYEIPPACGIYYYEVTILDKGQRGHISIGFSCPNVKLNRLPGWERESWGYHGDDGNSFASEREGSPFGPKFTSGDVIGCGIDFTLHKAFYTKNGTFLGYVFDNIGKDKPIFPAVGLRTPNEQIRVNFGQDPFRYDIEYHVHGSKERTWQKIQSTPIRWSIDDAHDIFVLEADKPPVPVNVKSAAAGGSSGEAMKIETEAGSNKGVKQEPQEDDYEPIQLPPDYAAPINKLIMTYLTHHGYERTAIAFRHQTEARANKASGAMSDAPSGKLPLRKIEELDVDIKMETDDDLPASTAPIDFGGPFDLDAMESEATSKRDSSQSRQQIVNAVMIGDIDLALRFIQELYPSVLENDDGLMLLKLRCRKFIELMLHASVALRKTKSEPLTKDHERLPDQKDGGAMEVDDERLASTTVSTNGFCNGEPALSDDSSTPLSPRIKRTASREPRSPAVAEYYAALSKSLEYGRGLQTDYHKADARPEVQTLLKKTFSLVTYDDPLEAGGEVAELASQSARSKLAQEVNQAILESQGRPSRPALERLYRQTAAVLMQLAVGGVGEAAFADMEKEFLES